MCFTACMQGKGREHVTCLVAQAPNSVTFEMVAILRGRKVYFVEPSLVISYNIYNLLEFMDKSYNS